MISAPFGGKPLEAVVRAFGNHEAFFSLTIERESQEVILKLSKKLSKEQIAFIQEEFQRMLSLAKRISIPTRLVLSRDAKDNHYLSLCKEVRADFLITGDKDLLSISRESLKKNGISSLIVSPQEFLEKIS